MEKSKETRRYLQTGVVKIPTPLHEDKCFIMLS